MIGYTLRRLGVAVVLLWILSVITFAIYLKVPADPAGFLIDMQHASPQQIAQAHHLLGTDRPAIVQYGKYMDRLLHGDFGMSWATISFFGGSAEGSPVGPMVWRAALVTGSLAARRLRADAARRRAARDVRGDAARARSSTGSRSGSASRRSRRIRSSSGCCCSCSSATAGSCCRRPGTAPSRSRRRRWSPRSARTAPTGTPLPCGGVGQWAWHLLLPWLTFALFFVALYMRIVRARMLEVLEEPWVRTARAKGASELRVIRSHALRNAIAPVVTMVAMDAGTAIGVAMYVETVFGLPGLGRTLIRALAGLQGYDLPVILAITLVAAAAIIVLNLIADLVLLAIDPTVARRTRPRRVPAARACGVRILIVSQMYPGPDDPDLGSFVAQQERALRERGHDVSLAVLDRRAGGKARFLELRRRVRAAATPDVVWAHFLVPVRAASRPSSTRRSSSPRTAVTCATSAPCRASRT